MIKEKVKKSRFLDVEAFPTILDDIHESVFRSTQILKIVFEMLQRNDSRETIIEAVLLMTAFSPKTMKRPIKEEIVKVDLDETMPDVDVVPPEFEKETNIKSKKHETN